MDSKVSHFAETLKRLMRERGITPKALSRATGIPSSTLSEWSAGREPRLGDQLIRLSRFLGVSIEYLATGKSPDLEPLEELAGILNEGVVTVHRGVYRVTIEKVLNQPQKDSRKKSE